MKAKQLVESILGADNQEPEDRHERAYARLQKLAARRSELQSEQMFHATWATLLRRLRVAEDNIKSLDIDQGKLHGIYLKQGDYGAKIARKDKARSDRAQFVASAEDDETARNAPKLPQEVSAYYVPVVPPLFIPVAVRRSWGMS